MTPVILEAAAQEDHEPETWLPHGSYAPPEASRCRTRDADGSGVWGPTGAPGWTKVAIGLVDEAPRLGVPTLLADAPDVCGWRCRGTAGRNVVDAGGAAVGLSRRRGFG